jgi:hypothetical protein
MRLTLLGGLPFRFLKGWAPLLSVPEKSTTHHRFSDQAAGIKSLSTDINKLLKILTAILSSCVAY